MFLWRMAYRLTLLCFVIWTILSLPAADAAAVATTNITDEILNFVPPCAQSCFESFISVNFDARICGNSPSLQCLCRQRGGSGYTVGEGGVACIVGEAQSGNCQGTAGLSEATNIAYNMCVGVSEAATRTHATIVATLFVPPSGTGPLLFPTPTETKATTISTTTPSATPTPTTSTSTDASTTTTAGSTGLTSPESTETASPAISGGQKQLTSAQIAGIALGCAAVLVLGVLIVLLARCVRRRRMGDMESGFAKMRDSTSFGRKSRPSSLPDIQISSPLPRIHVERNPMDPRLRGGMSKVPQGGLPNIPQEGLGLGLAQFGAGPTSRRTPSPAPTPIRKDTPPAPARTAGGPTPAAAQQNIPRLVLSPPPETRAPTVERSPPKPTLALQIPNGPGPTARVPASGRDSVVTEFAEDGEGDSAAPRTSIWRPPATDPQSATTYYFADKGGNWVLRNTSTRNAQTTVKPQIPTQPVEVPAGPFEVELPSPEHKTRAERARDVYGGFSPDAVVSPLRLPRKPGQAKLGSPIAFKDQRREPSIASPDPSVRISLTAETVAREPRQPNNRTPDVYFGMVSGGRDLTGGKGRRRSVKRTSRRVSMESATSIESAAAAPFEDEDIIDDEPQVDLSPVAESPNTPISPGKSPVTYPKIRRPTGNDRQQAGIGSRAPESDLLPPAHRYNIWHPPGRASPTGAAILPMAKPVTSPSAQSTGPSPRPWNAPSLNPVPNRNPARLRTGSPEVARPDPASPIEDQYWQRQRQVGNPASYWNRPQNPPAARQPGPGTGSASRQPPRPTPPYELPGENMTKHQRRGPYATPPQQYQQQQRGGGGGGGGGGNPVMRPAPLPTPQQTPQQSVTGTPRAQKQQFQFQQLTQQPQQQQQQPPTRPPPRDNNNGPGPNQISLLAKRRGADKAAALVLGNTSANGNGNGNANGGSDATKRKAGKGKAGWTREVESPFGPVPITPGWVPELTPTRRGEDLVLSVR